VSNLIQTPSDLAPILDRHWIGKGNLVLVGVAEAGGTHIQSRLQRKEPLCAHITLSSLLLRILAEDPTTCFVFSDGD